MAALNGAFNGGDSPERARRPRGRKAITRISARKIVTQPVFREEGGRPNDERGFLHKSRIGRFVGGVVERAIPAVGIASTVVRTIRGGRGTVSRTQTARVTEFSQAEKNLGRSLKFPEATTGQGTMVVSSRGPRAFGGGGGSGRTNGPCPPGMRPDFKSGQCEAAAGQAVGEAIMGRYGAGVLPGSMIIDRAVCQRGMQLADDGVCYNKSQITNKQRAWPAGRKPLLSGGDMRAISIAARAGRRLEGATKRLQRLGMMKKPTSRRAPPHQHAVAARNVVSV